MSSSNPSSRGREASPSWPLATTLTLVALLVVGWSLWQAPAAGQKPVEANSQVAVVEATVAAPEAESELLPEAPADALLPANDLTDERLARYWGETVDIIQRLHAERALSNESLAIIPPSKFQRAVWRLSNPKASHPDLAQQWRALRHRDENGRIAPDGLINAIRHREDMVKRGPRLAQAARAQSSSSPKRNG